MRTGYALIVLAIITLSAGLTGWILMPIWPALLLSFLFYLLLQKPVDRLYAYGLPYTLAITVSLLPPLLFIALLGFDLFQSAQQYLPELPQQIDKIQNGIRISLSSFEE